MILRVALYLRDFLVGALIGLVIAYVGIVAQRWFVDGELDLDPRPAD